MNIRQTLKTFNYGLAVATIAFAIFGIFMIRSATTTGVITRFETLYTTQLLYVVTGIMLMLTVALIDYHFANRFYILVYAVSILLLIVVLLIGKDDATGTARWIRIPVPGLGEISIQPSEFTKIFIVIFLAQLIEKKKETFNHILMLGAILMLVIVPVLLIQRQPSLSASLVVVFAALSILFAAGLYFRTIIVGLSLVIPAGVVVYFDLLRKQPLFIDKILSNYQLGRIDTFLNPVKDPDAYRQVQGSLFAIGSGSLYGKGYGNNSYVINGHNDFIFSVIAEQFGFVGSAAVLGVMAFIIVQCLLTARRAPDLSGRLIASGVAGILLFETFINVCVVTALMPNTGMPFPFLSYGGSSMWVHMIAIGMVLNVGLPRTKSIFESEG